MNKKYYFIAIGGVGMSGLAKYLLEQGCEVSGSDICDSKYVQQLRDLGAVIHIGHSAENVPDNCVVIASTAIRANNPEILRAKELGLPIYHRSDLLAEISRGGKFFIGYAGTHGKTTTSGLASYVLEKAGLNPSFVVGGIVPEISTNAQYRSGKYFVAELDESDGTIVKYSPDTVVINNLEADHLDFYKEGLSAILDTFEKFLSGLKPDAIILANNDSDGVEELIGGCSTLIPNHICSYGLNEADYTAKNIVYGEDSTTYDIYYKDEFLTDMKIILKGVHNVYNSLAVFASLHQDGVDINLIKPHFATFSGMGRRFQKVGEFGGISLYDDYAHHPTEIKATLSAASSFSNHRVIAVFQPHRYTRLKSLWNEFLDSFDGVDKVIVTDVYAASEDSIDGINSENFTTELQSRGIPCEYIAGDMKSVAQQLYPELKSGDVVIGLGAGTITTLGKELLQLDKEMEKVAG